MLLVEAIIAAFLMIFAFAISAALYDASLRWEANTTSILRASLLAERKMEEIRSAASRIDAQSFAVQIDAILTGPHLPYPDAPAFTFEVGPALDNIHKVVPTSGFTPTNGVHSPCSTFFTRPSNPGSVNRSSPPYASDPNGDFQMDAAYESFPYSRAMPNSYRLVQVRVRFGDGDDHKVDLISLIGDPIAPPARPDPNINQTLKIVRTSGPPDLTGANPAAEYEIHVTTATNAPVDDVSAVWSIHPLSSGTADIFPLNASGTRVRITRSPFSENGTQFRLFPQIRYEGQEARALSDPIAL